MDCLIEIKIFYLIFSLKCTLWIVTKMFCVLDAAVTYRKVESYLNPLFTLTSILVPTVLKSWTTWVVFIITVYIHVSSF